MGHLKTDIALALTLFILDVTAWRMLGNGPDPTLTVKYDSDANSAQGQRKIIFEDAAKHGYLLAAAHISFPGLGHILKVGKTYVWEPVIYTTVFPPPAP